MMQATVEWPKSTFKSLKTTKTSHLPTFHFVQFLEGVQPERSWDLTLEVQVDYFFTGFSVNTVVLLRVYNQQFQGNILCLVLETSRAGWSVISIILSQSYQKMVEKLTWWLLGSLRCHLSVFVSFFDIFPSSATSFNPTELSTRAPREVQHHDIPLAMWASKILREMVRLLVNEWRQVDLLMIQGMWPIHWNGDEIRLVRRTT